MVFVVFEEMGLFVFFDFFCFVTDAPLEQCEDRASSSVLNGTLHTAVRAVIRVGGLLGIGGSSQTKAAYHYHLSLVSRS